MVILEEAAHMDSDVFFQVVVPLLTVRHTAVLAISTPDDEFNYYTALLECGLFKTIRVGLMCMPCVAKGIQCIHMGKHLPSWKSSENHEKVMKVMEHNKLLAAREIGGLIVTSKSFVFQTFVGPLKAAPLYQLQQKPRVLHCGIDPSGGGKKSDWSMFTGCFEAEHRVVRINRVYNNKYTPVM